jgi:hypothetical protein
MEDPVGYGRRRSDVVVRHLMRCGCCREEALTLAGEARLLRAAFAALPLAPDFTEGVLARIGAERVG